MDALEADGALISDLKAHVAAGKAVFSQLGTELKSPSWYSKNHEYGGRPKYLYHWTGPKMPKTWRKLGTHPRVEEIGG